MTDDTLDGWVDDFAARALRPRRARLGESLATLTHADGALCEAVAREGGPDALRTVLSRHFAATGRVYAGHVDPAEAWESVAPDGWIADPTRAFVTEASLGREATMSAIPATLGAVLAFASDPEGMLTAEALAAEHAQRCLSVFTAATLRRCEEGAPWAGPRPVTLRCAWRVRASGAMSSRWLRALDPRSESPLGEVLLTLADGSSVTHDRANYAAKRTLQRMLPRVGASAVDASEVVRRSTLYAHLGGLNPFAPLVDLWKTGYVLSEYGDGLFGFSAPEV